MARQEGLEPPTSGLEGPCSIQLSYCRNQGEARHFTVAFTKHQTRAGTVFAEKPVAVTIGSRWNPAPVLHLQVSILSQIHAEPDTLDASCPPRSEERRVGKE